MKCDYCDREGLSQKELAAHVKYYHKKPPARKEQSQKFASGVCPDCGDTLFHQEGCASCQSCGFSKCA